MKAKYLLTLIAALFTITPLSATHPTLGQNLTTAQASVNSRADRAKAAASQLTGIPANRLTLVREAPLADTGITRYKLTDAQGKIYGVSLDRSGNVVTQATLDQAVQVINNRGFVGKLESELANRLTQRSNVPVNVIIVLKGEATAPSRSNTQSRAQQEDHLGTLRTRNIGIEQPVVNRLQTTGQQVIYRSAYAPLVVAAVTPAHSALITINSSTVELILQWKINQTLLLQNLADVF